MATQTASTRQPFAPLNHSRLQNLTNLKNRQNALITPSTLQKRKATTFESDLSSTDNSENIDPIHFLSPKRSCPSTSSPSTYTKPTNYFLTRAPPSPNFTSLSTTTPLQTRKILSPKARTATPRIDTSKKIVGSVSGSGSGNGGIALSAPAGRSPTRKRVGILNRRKTGTPIFSRVEPPKFSLGGGSKGRDGGLGFSIDAALSGTIPSYSSSRPITTSSTPSAPEVVPTNDFSAIPLLHTESVKESWFFAIHEDTEEELATNLMEHSTCILDISSDEESSTRLRDERGKENIAPADDISQTRSSLPSSGGRMGEVEANEMNMENLKKSIRRRTRGDEIDIDREPLGALKAEDFYPEGCDESSVFLIPSSDHLPSSEEPTQEGQELDLSPEKNKGIDLGLGSEEGMIETEVVEERTIDELMSRDDSAPRKAALLQPIEKAEEGWTLWESGSVDGEETGA